MSTPTICRECHKAICKCHQCKECGVEHPPEWVCFIPSDFVAQQVGCAPILPNDIFTEPLNKKAIDELLKLRPGASWFIKDGDAQFNWRRNDCHCRFFAAGSCPDCAFDIQMFWTQIALAGALQVTRTIDYQIAECLSGVMEVHEIAGDLRAFVESMRHWMAVGE